MKLPPRRKPSIDGKIKSFNRPRVIVDSLEAGVRRRRLLKKLSQANEDKRKAFVAEQEANREPPPKTMPCVCCGLILEEVFDGSLANYQPYNGGQVSFVFSYGSCEYDECSGVTEFNGVICDKCASGFVQRMNKSMTNMNGLPTYSMKGQ